MKKRKKQGLDNHKLDFFAYVWYNKEIRYIRGGKRVYEE